MRTYLNRSRSRDALVDAQQLFPQLLVLSAERIRRGSLSSILNPRGVSVGGGMRGRGIAIGVRSGAGRSLLRLSGSRDPQSLTELLPDMVRLCGCFCGIAPRSLGLEPCFAGLVSAPATISALVIPSEGTHLWRRLFEPFALLLSPSGTGQRNRTRVLLLINVGSEAGWLRSDHLPLCLGCQFRGPALHCCELRGGCLASVGFVRILLHLHQC